ncbi:hypothetical protein [Psychromonas sp.]|uniref:hypothetical protein n=1 Tax=Psychromonas sp. TaxID=1884585 RepID=UPI0039E30790
MQVKIFKAHDVNLLKTGLQNLCNEGAQIKNVKFETFGDSRKLLVYFTEDASSKKQEVVALKKTIKGTINFLNKELSTNVACLDTVPYNVNGLMAIVIKNI